MTFKRLPKSLRAYILLSITGGFLALGVVLAETTHPPHGLLVLLLVLSSIVFATWKVYLTIRGSVMTLTSAVVCLSMLLPGAGPILAVTCAAVGALIGTVVRPNNGRWFPRFEWNYFWYRIAFNVAICVLAAALAAASFDIAVSSATAVSGYRSSSVSVMVIGTTTFQIVYFLANTLAVSGALAFSEGKGLLALWRRNFLWTWPSYLASGSIAVGISMAYRDLRIGAWALLLLPPVYIIYYSYRLHLDKIQRVQELNELNSAIIASLATAIDAKDRCTRSHINRVQAYAVSLGEKMGLAQAELEALRTGALLHDIGKLGIPESILAKPGKLTPEEYRLMQQHVFIGAQILEPVKFPYPVIPIVLTHHERWDGLGYPNGLEGKNIPIGGRIMAIADVFDALTSDRPYRRALSPDEALDVLRMNAGKHFDPDLVECFERILPDVLQRIAAIDAATESSKLPVAATSSDAGNSSVDTAWLLGRSTPMAELIRSIRRARSVEEAVARVAEHVLACFPVDTAAVYLYRSETEALEAVSVRGRFADNISGISLEVGQGVSGWAAKSRSPQLNAQALLDLGPRFTPAEQPDLTAATSVPLFHGDQTLGVLTVYSGSYTTFRLSHLIALSRVADCLTAVLLDLQPSHVSQASDAALRAEPFTVGMRPLVELLDEWVKEDHGNGSSASSRVRLYILEVLDGHASDAELPCSGDDLSDVRAWGRQLSNLLSQGGANRSLVCHYARNVFVVGLCDHAAGDCEAVRERLLQWMQAHGGGEAAGRVRMGEAGFPEDGTDAVSLLAAAEQSFCLQQLKRGEIAPGW